MKVKDLGSFSPAHQDKIKCTSCGSFVEGCNGDECDECHKFTCYECGTIFFPEPEKRQWLCTACAEQAQLDFEGEPDEDEPDYLELATGISKTKLHADLEKLTIRSEAKAQRLEEARGK